MKTVRLAFLLLPVSLSLVACTRQGADAPPAQRPESSPTAPNYQTDQWLGQWTGPEGTFLRLSGGDGRYEVVIQNLDGPQTFHGRAAGDHIEFERNGVTESIRATNGAETGMKWLSEKSDCLTIKPGEGYCRD